MPVVPRIVLITGVSGTGKTTIGRFLASELHWPYFEADDFHSSENKDKMGRGIPLNDDDRAPWLAAIRECIDECISSHRSAVFTCSALKEGYRRVLMANAPSVTLVYLAGDSATIRARLSQREKHYMKPAMLDSQLDALEVPANAIILHIGRPPTVIVAEIIQALVDC